MFAIGIGQFICSARCVATGQPKQKHAKCTYIAWLAWTETRIEKAMWSFCWHGRTEVQRHKTNETRMDKGDTKAGKAREANVPSLSEYSKKCYEHIEGRNEMRSKGMWSKRKVPVAISVCNSGIHTYDNVGGRPWLAWHEVAK